MKEVEELCGRIAFISDGRIAEIGSVSELKGRKFGANPVFNFLVEGRGIPPEKEARLLKLGFRVAGNIVSKQAPRREAGAILKALSEAGIQIGEIDVVKPGLEEYFIRMTEDAAEPENRKREDGETK
ncbi:MAG: hypothetical protein V1820_02625 [archaeon]